MSAWDDLRNSLQRSYDGVVGARPYDEGVKTGLDIAIERTRRYEPADTDGLLALPNVLVAAGGWCAPTWNFSEPDPNYVPPTPDDLRVSMAKRRAELEKLLEAVRQRADVRALNFYSATDRRSMQSLLGRYSDLVDDLNNLAYGGSEDD